MTTGILRAPRAVLAIAGGQIVPTEVSVEMTTYRKSDTFMARVSLDAVPGMDEIFWSSLTNTTINVLATNDANSLGLASIFLGNVDVVDIDWMTRTASITGRDLAAALLETKTTENFTNQTTTQVVQTICSRVGLTANVSVPSNDNVGLTYKTDTVRITDQDSLFNVLTRLAQRSGCVFYVTGKTLHFRPADTATGGNFTIGYVRPTPLSIAQGNFISLKSRRNYVLSRNVTVRTRSWQLKQKQSVLSELDMGGSVNGAIAYEYRAPNMTKQQADDFSQGRLNDITSQEKTLDIDMPGDTALTPEMGVTLVGTGTTFDQSYTVSRVSHNFSQGGGYRMTISTRNRDKNRTIQHRVTASNPGTY